MSFSSDLNYADLVVTLYLRNNFKRSLGRAIVADCCENIFSFERISELVKDAEGGSPSDYN